MPVYSNDISFDTNDVGTFNSPLWRFFVANLAGEGLTDYSKLASDRVVEVILNGPLSITGTVPSDNPQVYIPRILNGDPYLAEGTTLMWAFRRESATPPYYVVRAAGLVQFLQDSAQEDNARTTFTASDPWRYLFSRPLCDADGHLPGRDGLTFTDTQVSEIIGTLLANTIINQGHTYIDAGATYIGTGFYTGTLETSAGMEITVTFQQGLSVGEAWQQLTDMNVCDIVLDPIYDPHNRPDYLVQLNVYAQAGSTRDEQIFAWNMPGRSLVAIERQQDGVGRANQIIFFTGQGGVFDSPTVPIATDATSIAKYGQSWAQQFFPGQLIAAAVQSLADRQLALRKDGRETVTFKPAPERSPRPWQDYQLGDRVQVWASAEDFRQLLRPATDIGSYQRIYGWTTNISDDALETIDPVLTSPKGFT